MRVMPMMWIVIAHISNPRRRYSAARVSKRLTDKATACLRARRCTSVQISVPLKTQQMLAPGQHLAQLGIVVWNHRALSQLIEEPAEPEAAYSDHRGGVIDVARDRQPEMTGLPSVPAFKLRRNQPEQVDEAHRDQQPGHRHQAAPVVLQIAR